MMIDEADEFVTGPQNKKRGGSGDPNSGAALKRRRSMSPLLRRAQTPPIIANHVAGKGPPGAQVNHSLIKPIPLLKGRPSDSWRRLRNLPGEVGILCKLSALPWQMEEPAQEIKTRV